MSKTALMQLHFATNQHEDERAQAVKSSCQTTALLKYLEQRELTLLRTVEDERKQHGM